MKYMLGIIVCYFTAMLYAQSPDTAWTKRYGGPSNEQGTDVKVTPDGGFIIVGLTLSYGAGAEDVWLIKTNSSGDTMWTKTYGGTNFDNAWSVKLTSDGGYIIIGNTSSFGPGTPDHPNVYLLKTNANGNTQWTHTYGGTDDDAGNDVIQTFDGGYLLGGWTSSFGDTTHSDVYLIKTNADGDTVWSRTYGCDSNDYATCLQQVIDGGYIVSGYTNSFGAGDWDGYVLRIDSIGDTLWTKTYGSSVDDRAYSIKQTSDNGYVVCGYTRSPISGNVDAFLIKIDSLGDTLWARVYGGENREEANDVELVSSPLDGYIIVGTTWSYGQGTPGSPNLFLVRVDGSGDTLWTKVLGDSNLEIGNAIENTLDGGYIIVGVKNAAGVLSDVWLVKMDTDVVALGEVNNFNESLLLDVFPCPLSKKCKVSYVLRHQSRIIITIYDVTGRLIRKIIGGLQAIGKRSEILDLTDLSQGIYYIGFQTEMHSAVKKIVVLK